MIIKSASFKRLNGHIDLELSFHPGVNILIGVNGSGKTSVLNAMAWTLSPASVQDGTPAAYLLAGLDFDEIKIAYANLEDDEVQQVEATRSGDTIYIGVNGVDKPLEIPVIGEPDARYATRP